MDFKLIIRYAWMAYDSTRKIESITDVSAMVSTNHVYKIQLDDGNNIIAKLSNFGKHEYFVEDHTIINVLSNNLSGRYENFLSRSLMKGRELFVHRFKNEIEDAWVVFYRPIKIKNKPPKRFNKKDIKNLAREFALFHKDCHLIRHTLPTSTKSMRTDILNLLEIADSGFPEKKKIIKKQCNLFLDNVVKIKADKLDIIPVFVDWNIGNFSLSNKGKFFSRWDYDWFRMSSRMLDFYFISRVVSDIGDKTVFTYNAGTMMEDRFILFLKEYHKIFPLSKPEILFLKEGYRFFLLNYVIREGKYFFREKIANQLQEDVFEYHFDELEKIFNADKILKALNL